MLTKQDFEKKQIVFVFFNEGEKLAFSNDNIVVKNKDGSVKFQCTCYRVFIVYAVGDFSITSVIIRNAKKFGFYIAMLTSGFRLYALIGGEKDGNTLLHRTQYRYDGLEIAKHITQNKIHNQYMALAKMRNKSDIAVDAMHHMKTYLAQVEQAQSIQEIMGYEGMASKLYFPSFFNNVVWNGRQPRIKADYTNATLDIGYTVLFTFVDSLLLSFGFDTYCGVLHRQFYLRKSLTCDMVEPFRVLIDMQVKRALGLKQIQEKDFTVVNHQYRLNWKESPRYVKFLMEPIIKNKDEIFAYVRDYYRCFMKQTNIGEYPSFVLEGEA